MAALRPLMERFPQLGNAEDLDPASVSDTVTHLQQVLGQSQEPLTEALKLAFNDIPVA